MQKSTSKRGSDGKHASFHQTRARRAGEIHWCAEALGRRQGWPPRSQIPRRRRGQASQQAFGDGGSRARQDNHVDRTSDGRTPDARTHGRQVEIGGRKQGPQGLHEVRTAHDDTQARPVRRGS